MLKMLAASQSSSECDYDGADEAKIDREMVTSGYIFVPGEMSLLEGGSYGGGGIRSNRTSGTSN